MTYHAAGFHSLNHLHPSDGQDYSEGTTSLRGHRTRQICGFFMPAPLAGVASFWRDERGKYNSLRANTPRRRNAVVESRRPSFRVAQLNVTEVHHGQ